MISSSIYFLLLISLASGVLAEQYCDSKCGSVLPVIFTVTAFSLLVILVITFRKKVKKAVKNPYTLRSTNAAPSSSPNYAILAKYKNRNRSIGEPSAPSRVVISMPLSASERNITSPYSSCTVETPSPIPSNDCVSYPPPYHAENRPPKYY